MKKNEKSFEDRIITTANPEAERKRKKFTTQVITTKDLSDKQIRQGLEGPKPKPIVTTGDTEEKEENEEESS